MKKALPVLLAAAALLLCLLTGCGGTASGDFDPAKAAEALVNSEAFSDLLSPVELKIAASLYAVEADSIVACGAYCSTGATAEEIAVFQCRDAAAAKALESAAKARLDSQKAAYASYAPQAVPAIENAILQVRGSYVACVVAWDRDAAQAVLDQYMK